jgi:hypothetical protein
MTRRCRGGARTTSGVVRRTFALGASSFWRTWRPHAHHFCADLLFHGLPMCSVFRSKPKSHKHDTGGRLRAPPHKPTAASGPGGRWGSVVFGWRALRPPRVVFVIGCVSCNKFSHFRQKVRFLTAFSGSRFFFFFQMSDFGISVYFSDGKCGNTLLGQAVQDPKACAKAWTSI